MTLTDYLAEHDLSDADFALRIGVNRSTISRLRRTNQRPSFETMNAIAAATDGVVTANDFWLDADRPAQADAA